MKRFKISYQIKGEDFELYAEPMDDNHRMYSLERQLMDPHPLLIEHDGNTWKVTSQDSWGLEPEEVTRLGDYLESEYPNRPQE
ncbi:MAG TPA: hypothetical protein VF602_00885 [Pedobacter sp.]|jgi:hypothetical protein